MSESLNYTSGLDPEIPRSSAESKKDSKEKSKKDAANNSRKLAASVLNKRSEGQHEVTPKEAPKQPAKSFLGDVIGKEEQKGVVNPAQEKSGEELEPTEESTAEDAKIEEVITEQVERNIAEDLYNGEEISLHEISQIPPERDEDVIDEALEIATALETTVVGYTQEENEGVQELPSVEENVEAEPVKTESKEPEVERPAVVPVPIPTPRIPRTRSYNGRPTGAASFNVPPAYVGGGTLGGNTPPPSGYSANHSPGYSPNAAPSAQDIRRTMEDAEWQGRQNGRREGVFAGLLVGGGIEHFRHKRREKKMEKRQKKETLAQQKRVERLEHDYEIARQNQKSEQARSEANLTGERLATAADRANRDKELVELKKTQERLTQQTTEVRPSAEELLAAMPKDHRIERSAWHNIEVDKHGRAVQESAIEYGHEYYKERTHEISPSQHVDVAAGEVALVAAALSEAEDRSQAATSVAQALSVVNAPQQSQPHSLRDNAQTVLKTVTTPPSSPFATLVWFGVLVVIAVVIFAVAR
jgi:hypothetical protein